METTTLWTRQVPQVLEELNTTGSYRVKKEYIIQKNDTIADFYLDLYKWYTTHARSYIEIPRNLEYPIWLSVDEDNTLQPTENTVILKAEIPNDKFIIANMDAWGYRVNYWYIPLDEEDAKKHKAELLRYGIHEEDSLISTDKGNFYPLLRRKITDSWERVFTLPPEKCDMMVATTWELKKEWISEVRTYHGE